MNFLFLLQVLNVGFHMTIFKTLSEKFPLAFFLAFTFPSTPALKDPINKSHDPEQWYTSILHIPEDP